MAATTLRPSMINTMGASSGQVIAVSANGAAVFKTLSASELDMTGYAKTNVSNGFTDVQRFTAVGRPGLEIWDTATYDNNAVRFGPQGGISFATGGVWQSGSFANLKNALYNDRAGLLPDLTISVGAGVSAGVGVVKDIHNAKN